MIYFRGLTNFFQIKKGKKFWTKKLIFRFEFFNHFLQDWEQIWMTL